MTVSMFICDAHIFSGFIQLVTRNTEFAGPHVTSTHIACKDERQINRKLRFGSGRQT
jgi:hypothetical protein